MSKKVQVRILYPQMSRNPMILVNASLGVLPSWTDVQTYYLEVSSFEIGLKKSTLQLLDELFVLYNSEKNPLSCPESQAQLRDAGSFTSMSAGCIIAIDSIHWGCTCDGWEKL